MVTSVFRNHLRAEVQCIDWPLLTHACSLHVPAYDRLLLDSWRFTCSHARTRTCAHAHAHTRARTHAHAHARTRGVVGQVFPKLNKTISYWRADDRNRGPYAENMPAGSVANVYQSLNTAWTQTVPTSVVSVISIAGQNWYLDGECGGYNQNAWKCIYSPAHGPNGAWLADPQVG